MDSPENEKLFPSEVKPRTADVLFVDIVGYSLLSANGQTDAVRHLQSIIWKLPGFRESLDEDKLIYIPTGDGAAIVCFDDPTIPAQFARDIAIRIGNDKATFALRMGLHSGVVFCWKDTNHKQRVHVNVAGGGINIAQRVMDRGDAGHILVSKTVAETLQHLDAWKLAVHRLGECEVKHGVKLDIFNLFTKEFGNASPPGSFQKDRDSPNTSLLELLNLSHFSQSWHNVIVLGILACALLIFGFLLNGSVGPTYIRGQLWVNDGGKLTHAEGWRVEHGEEKAISNPDGYWTLPLSANGFPRRIHLGISPPAQPETAKFVNVIGPLPFWNTFFPMDDINYYFDQEKKQLLPMTARLLPFFGGLKSVYAQSRQQSQPAVEQAEVHGPRSSDASCALSLNAVKLGEFPGFFRSSGRAYFQMYLDGKPVDSKALLYGRGIGSKVGHFPLKSDKELWLPVRTGSDDNYTGLLANLTQVATCSPDPFYGNFHVHPRGQIELKMFADQGDFINSFDLSDALMSPNHEIALIGGPTRQASIKVEVLVPNPAPAPVTLTGIINVAFAHTSNRIALAHPDGLVEVVSPDAGEVVTSLRTQSQGMVDIGFSAGDAQLAIIESDMSFSTWDINTQRIVTHKTIPFHPVPPHSAFLENSRLVSVDHLALRDLQVTVWKTPELSQVYSDYGSISSLLVSANDQVAVFYTNSAELKLVALAPKPHVLKRIPWPSDTLSGAAFSADATMIAAASHSRAVTIMNVSQPDKKMLLQFDSKVSNVEFTPDGKKLVAFSDSEIVYVVDLDKGSTQRLNCFKNIKKYSFSPDSLWLAISDGYDKAQIRRMPS